MPTNGDVVSLQMEKVRDKLQDLFETSSLLSSAIKKGAETETVSTRDYRIPLVVASGGDYGTFNPDGGDMGRGSGMQAVHMISAFFTTKLAFELTDLQMNATAKSDIAVAKVFAKTISSAMKMFQAYDDFAFHRPADAVIGIGTAHANVGGVSVYTLDSTFATQLFRRGMPVHVYDTTLATQRTTPGSAPRVTAVDIPNNKVTLSALIGSAASTDKITFDGVVGATPTWKHGLPYFASSTSSGNLLSLSKSANPEIISSYVNAASNGLLPAYGLALLDQMTQRRDDIGKLKGVAHQKQRNAWYIQGIQISEWQRGKSDEMIDIVPKVGNGTAGFTFCGIDHMIDKHQNRSRIDWIDFSTFGRMINKELDYHTVEGRKLFELRGTSGGVAAGMLFYLEQHEDWYNSDPGSLGYIDNLTIPSVP